MRYYTKARYDELCDTYKVSVGEPPKPDRFDVIVKFSCLVLGGARFEVLKNRPGLPPQDLATICSMGKSIRGFRVAGPYIVISVRG